MWRSRSIRTSTRELSFSVKKGPYLSRVLHSSLFIIYDVTSSQTILDPMEWAISSPTMSLAMDYRSPNYLSGTLSFNLPVGWGVPRVVIQGLDGLMATTTVNVEDPNRPLVLDLSFVLSHMQTYGECMTMCLHSTLDVPTSAIYSTFSQFNRNEVYVARKGIAQSLDSLRTNDIMYDAHIICSCCQNPIKAHHLLMVGRSSYFKRLFLSQDSIKQQSDPYVIDLRSFNGRTVHSMVTFFYTGDIMCNEIYHLELFNLFLQLGITDGLMSLVFHASKKMHNRILGDHRMTPSITMFNPDMSIINYMRDIKYHAAPDCEIMINTYHSLLSHRLLLVAFSNIFYDIPNRQHTHFTTMYIQSGHAHLYDVLLNFIYADGRSIDKNWRSHALSLLNKVGMIKMDT